MRHIETFNLLEKETSFFCKKPKGGKKNKEKKE